MRRRWARHWSDCGEAKVEKSETAKARTTMGIRIRGFWRKQRFRRAVSGLVGLNAVSL